MSTILLKLLNIVCAWTFIFAAPDETVRSGDSPQQLLNGDGGRKAAAAAEEEEASLDPPPNVLIFLVDDLGWNQVGYHAKPAGNNEIQTPNIDAAAATGIELNRGYVTPWYESVFVCSVFVYVCIQVLLLCVCVCSCESTLVRLYGAIWPVLLSSPRPLF